MPNVTKFKSKWKKWWSKVPKQLGGGTLQIWRKD